MGEVSQAGLVLAEKQVRSERVKSEKYLGNQVITQLQWIFVMKTVGVDCIFAEDGAVQVKKVWLNGRWQSVGQGRQWLDEDGRHVLIMLPGEEVRELVLLPGTLRWEVVEIHGRRGGTAV